MRFHWCSQFLMILLCVCSGFNNYRTKGFWLDWGSPQIWQTTVLSYLECRVSKGIAMTLNSSILVLHFLCKKLNVVWRFMLLGSKAGLIANTLRQSYLKATVNTVFCNSIESSTGDCQSKFQIALRFLLAALRHSSTPEVPRLQRRSCAMLCCCKDTSHFPRHRFWTHEDNENTNWHHVASRWLDRHQWLPFAELAPVLVGQPSPRSIWQFNTTKKSNLGKNRKKPS